MSLLFQFGYCYDCSLILSKNDCYYGSTIPKVGIRIRTFVANKWLTRYWFPDRKEALLTNMLVIEEQH